MKKQNFEQLLGGPQAAHLSRDAMIGLNGLGRRFQEKAAEDELFETAIRRANDEQLRSLARLRLNSGEPRLGN